MISFKKYHRMIWASSAAALLLGLGIPAHAADLTVCESGCNYTTIQAAVNSAKSDDNIYVGAGTYKENVILPGGKNLNIIGEGKDTTILDGENLHRLFKVNSGSSIVLDGFTLQNGNSQTLDCGGGAIRMFAGSSLAITNCDFLNNTNMYSKFGGAIYADMGCALAVENSDFINNISSGHGGVLYAKGATVSFVSCNLTSNSTGSAGYGGAIYLAAGSDLTLVDSLLSENSCTYQSGGAIYSVGSVISNIDNCAFDSNVSKVMGGAIYSKLNSGDSAIYNSVFNNNHTIGTTSGTGGAIQYMGGHTLHLESCSFTDNAAKQYGGALHISGAYTKLDVVSCYFDNNDCTLYDGGAIYTNGTTTTNVTIGDTDFINSDARTGAAIYIRGGKLEVLGASFTDNNLMNPVSYDGGSIYMINTIGSSLRDCDFSGSTARNGGAVYSNNNANFTIANSVFANNAAGAEGTKNGRGGAVYFINGINTVTDCAFDANSATNFGSAIYKQGGKLTLLNSNFTNNTLINPAISDGGAIYLVLTSGSSIDRCLVTGSVARHGAGLYAAANTNLKITNSLFYNNIAGYGDGASAGRGGAIAFMGGSNTVTNCTLADNSVAFVNGVGGAIYNGGGANTKVYNSIVYYNDASNISKRAIQDDSILTATDLIMDGPCAGCNVIARVSSANPSFVDRDSNDYHINLDSPAVDSGRAILGTPALDIDGDARPSGANWDIGADEI